MNNMVFRLNNQVIKLASVQAAGIIEVLDDDYLVIVSDGNDKFNIDPLYIKKIVNYDRSTNSVIISDEIIPDETIGYINNELTPVYARRTTSEEIVKPIHRILTRVSNG